MPSKLKEQDILPVQKLNSFVASAAALLIGLAMPLRDLPAQSRSAAQPAKKAVSTRTAQTPVHSLTFHYDNARLGWNNRETKLTPATVRAQSFGRLWDQPLDGFVNGSPLQVSGINVGGQKRDVVYAATERNSVYALDAASGKVLWSRKQLAPPIHSNGVLRRVAPNIVHGVLSTPVIDLSSGTIYVCGLHAPGLRQQFVVWALDIRTGKNRPGWPVVVRGSYRNTPFVPGQVMQRGALSLVNGWVYVPFGGRGDTPPWRGWVMGIDTRRPTAPQRAFCTSPISDGAGVWSAAGVAADRNGDLFLVTGNGDFDLFRGGHNLGQTVLRLRPRGQELQFTRQRTDYYTPPNYKHLDDQDEDMGGATGDCVTDQPGTRTPRLLFTGGKDGLAICSIATTWAASAASCKNSVSTATRKRFITRAFAPRRPTSTPAAKAVFFSWPVTKLDRRAKRYRSVAPHHQWRQRPSACATSVDNQAALERPTSPVVTSQGSSNGIVWTVETRDEPNPFSMPSMRYGSRVVSRIWGESERYGDAVF
jgi:hypothetical protein